MCDSKKSKLIKEEKYRGLISILGIKTPSSKIPLVGSLLFQQYKIVGDKCMPEM